MELFTINIYDWQIHKCNSIISTEMRDGTHWKINVNWILIVMIEFLKNKNKIYEQQKHLRSIFYSRVLHSLLSFEGFLRMPYI